MGDGGVACVASQHVMEHFSTSEPYRGERSGNNINKIKGFDANSNSVKFSDHGSCGLEPHSSSHGEKEGCSADGFSKPQGTTAAGAITSITATAAVTFGATATAAVEHVDRPKRSSRWDVVEDGDVNPKIKENELRLGVGLHKQDGVDKLDEGLACTRENELGLALDSIVKDHPGNHTDKFSSDTRRGGLKSRRLSDDAKERSGYLETSLSRNSSDRYDRYDRYGGHYKSSSSRIPHDRHSRQFELSSSRGGTTDRYTRRSGSVDRSYSERHSHDRRWLYEERNGYRKSGVDKFHNKYGSQGHEDRQHHRDAGWRESRRHSNWRQPYTSWGDRVSDENKGRFSNSCGNYSKSSSSSFIKDSRSKDVEARLVVSPSQTPAAEQSEKFPDESLSEIDSARFSEPDRLSEELCKHEEARCRGWFYIDHLGIEQGPLKLGDLKNLVEDGLLQSDHLVKRDRSDEWVTVENAASPMPFGNLPLSISKLFPQTQIGQACETSMNKLGVVADTCKSVQGILNCDSQGRNNPHSQIQQDDSSAGQAFNNLEDFHIDERVERLMQGFNLIPGRENETVSEALRHAARHVNCDVELNTESEGSPGLRDGFGEYCSHWRDVELGRGFESITNESNVSNMAARSGAAVEKESDYDKDSSTAMGISFGSEGTVHCAGRWPSKGGDWKRIGEFENCTRAQNIGSCDRLLKKKVVLNDGALLCEIWKSGVPDPRRQLPEASCYAKQSKRLELPPWAYRGQEEKSDHMHKIDSVLEGHMQLGQSSIATPRAHASTPKSQVSTPISQISTPRGTAVTPCVQDGLKSTKINNGESTKSLAGNKSNQHKPPTVKGSNVCKAASSSQIEMKSVLQSNFTFFRNYGPLAWEPCAKSQSKGHNIVKAEQLSEQPLPLYGIGNKCDLPAESLSVSPSMVHKSDLQDVSKSEADELNEKTSSGYVGTVNDLRLHMGEWYYRDGACHEKGPLTFEQLQMLVSDGTLQNGSSVYRKSDNTWVPVSHTVLATEVLTCSSSSEMNNLSIRDCRHPENSTQNCQHVHSQEDTVDFPWASKQTGILKSSEEKVPVDFTLQHPGTASPVCNNPEQHKPEDCKKNQASYSFHDVYPQFIGYARGKLHEHVMKSYRSRDFAAAIKEGLDAWMSPKQSKKCTDMCFPSPVVAHPSSVADIAVASSHADDHLNPEKSEVKVDKVLNNSITGQHGIDHTILHAGFSVSESEQSGVQTRVETESTDTCGHHKRHHVSKRQRLQAIQESGKEYDGRNGLQADTEVDGSHEELEEVVSYLENNLTQNKMHGWGMMDFRILERIFHFLGADLKSIAFIAATCKRWHNAIRVFKGKSGRIDLSSMGPECTDAMFQSFMSGYGEGRIKHVALTGCINVSADALVHFLRGSSSIISVDITGCNQFKEVTRNFPNVKWQRSNIAGPSSSGDLSEESHCKVKSLKQINDKSYGTCKSSRGLDIHMSDDSAGKDTSVALPEADQGEPMDVDYFQVDSKASISPVHSRAHSVKHIKITSSGKSVKVPLEDANLKGDAFVKSSSVHPAGGDKGIEKHVMSALKAIMDSDTNNFILHEASEIEGKIKDGVYSGHVHGINSFKDDVFLICRKAFQEHRKGSPAFAATEKIFKTAHRQVAILKEKFEKSFAIDTQHQKYAYGNEAILRSGKDKSQSSFYSTSSNLKKRHPRGLKAGAKGIKRRRGMGYSNCGVDFEDYAHDRESRRPSKLKRRDWQDSETETSESSDFMEEDFLDKEDDKNDIEDSDLDMKLDSEGEDGDFGEENDVMEDEGLHAEVIAREWGARMTKVSLVPPVTRKYEVIEEYIVVADEDQVRRKMRVCIPEDYDEKLRAAKDKRDGDYVHLEFPELKDYKPRKRLGDEVVEQEVYGIDPYTHNLLLDSMPKGSDYSLQAQHQIIEEVLLRALNKKVRDFTGSGKTPMEYPLQKVVQRMLKDAEKAGDGCMHAFCQAFLKNMQNRQPSDKYVAYRKGLGVVCNKEGGFEKDDFVVEFLGEVYPAWRWFEKQDGIRSLQKKDKDPAPEFYNIFLERPKGDGAGYDLVVVDAMHKANYASRICHSCRPNCEAKVTAVGGQYQIGLYTLRPIQYGEEITFDYNSLTESKEEYEASVCLCGSQGCRGSYLNLAGAGAYQKVLKECHGLLNRHDILLEACTVNSVTQEDSRVLSSAGLAKCVLSELPDWAIAYSAHVVRFINLERSRLPDQILKHTIKEKKKAGVEIFYEFEKSDSEIQADGVYNQRLQNLAITLDKVRYVLGRHYHDPRKALPPLKKLMAAELVSLLWNGEQSLVEELLRCMTPYVDAERLNDLKRQVHAREPSNSENVEKSLRESLLWVKRCTARYAIII
eukprot:Gb_22849 [translate_table: standard]